MIATAGLALILSVLAPATRGAPPSRPSPAATTRAAATQPTTFPATLEGERASVDALDREVWNRGIAVGNADQFLSQAEFAVRAAAEVDKSPDTAADFARADPGMARMFQERVALRRRLDLDQINLGKQHPAVARSKANLQKHEAAIEARAQELREQYVVVWDFDGKTAVLVPRDLRQMRAELPQMRASYEQLRQRAREARLHLQAREAASGNAGTRPATTRAG